MRKRRRIRLRMRNTGTNVTIQDFSYFIKDANYYLSNSVNSLGLIKMNVVEVLCGHR